MVGALVSAGTLYVVATPLGNLGDLSARAAAVLRAVPIVAAEDTRRTRKLLSHLGARPRLVSVHAHASEGRLAHVVHELAAGRDVALVTDAGTPVVSDPGAGLVRRAHQSGLPVVAIPGPSAVVAALSVSGFSADRYTFLGFLPRRGAKRRELLHYAAQSPWTVVVFETAPRLVALLDELARSCGDAREAVVARELTKVHEEVRRGTLAELSGYYEERPPKGEITLVLAGSPRGEPPALERPQLEEEARRLRAGGLSRRDAAQRLAAEFAVSRREAYRIVSRL